MFHAAATEPVLRDNPAFSPAAGDPTVAVTGSGGFEILAALSIGLGFVALLAIRSVVTGRRNARAVARLARAHSDSMRDLLRTVRMAESLAGIGVWQYDYATGHQVWSEGLKPLFGIEREAPIVEGDADNLLYACGIDLVARVREHAESFETFAFEFTVCGFDGAKRTLCFHACNLRGRDGSVVRVVAVLRDATERHPQMAPTPPVAEPAPAPVPDPVPAPVPCEPREKQGTTDTLTGLPDQRHVMRELDQLVMQARRANEPLVLVVFEVDHFPRIASRHGSVMGDQVLRRVARILKDQVRAGDPVGRVSDRGFA